MWLGLVARAILVQAGWLACSAAQAVEVTLCHHESEAPSGGNTVNLNDALAIGGHITFRCKGPSTILVQRTHLIEKDTDLDGENMVTLDGGKNRFGMFRGSSGAVTFGLTRLKVARGGAAPPDGINVGTLVGGVVEGRFRSVLLQSVSIEQSWFPVQLTSGSLRVRHSSFTNNDGAVLSGSDIDIRERSLFSGNRGAPVHGETVVIDRSDFLANSEPIRVSRGSLKVYGSNFTNNVASSDGGAVQTFVDTTIEESMFRNNVADNGGALHIGAPAAKVSLRAVRFEGNASRNGGGAIDIKPSLARFEIAMAHVTFQDNHAVTGGAVSIDGGVRDNVLLNGGAVAFVRNVATNAGGGVYAPGAAVRLSRGVFVANRAGKFGGAMAVLQQGDNASALANSLMVRNVAPRGSAFWGNAATFINTTIADNDGTAVWPHPVPFGPLPGNATSFPIRFANTIVAGALIGADACGPTVATAPYTVAGPNLQFPNDSCGTGPAVAFPLLGAYYVPFVGSPALDAGSNAICGAAPINQADVYNTHRPRGGASCAIGAVEGDVSHLVKRWARGESSFTFGR